VINTEKNGVSDSMPEIQRTRDNVVARTLVRINAGRIHDRPGLAER